MKSLTDAMAFVKSWDGAIDNRDKGRFAEFVPFERIAEAGLEPVDGITKEGWGDTTEWTEENVLKQLKEDVKFGLEKARGQRGISVHAMFCCVNLWCHLLENGLAEIGYTGYGVEFFEKVAEHYGWRFDVYGITAGD